MKFCMLGSGSRGNAVYIESRGAAILVDQGFSHRELDKRMAERGIDPGKIRAILVTHEHGDHLRGVGVTARKLSLPVYGTAGTIQAKDRIFNGTEDIIAIEGGAPFSIGVFDILPYSVSHDAAEPVQYCITAGKCRLAIATDLGFASNLVNQSIKGSNAVILESNHDVQMLRNGAYSWQLKQRIMSRMGHLSNKNAAELLFNITTRQGIPKAVLAHLSEENNTPELAEREVRSLFEKFDRRLHLLEIAAQNTPSAVIEL